ncbi:MULTISPECIES: cAMP-binding domain-containing protein [Listeria]|uniref:cAMP-binding domain-containing protein n=1 Tax=Listeria TaxID=1637 RepID=UPI000B5941D6|nr:MULTISPECIES: cAMP-binding domain-containing protein [Listeria]
MKTIYQFLTTDVQLAKEYTKKVVFVPEEVAYCNEKSCMRDYIIFITKGMAILEIHHKGKWKFNTFLVPNDCAGIDNLLTPQTANLLPSKFKLIGATDGEFLVIEKEYFINHFYANPQIFSALYEKLSLRYIYTSFNCREKKAMLRQRMADLLLEFIILSEATVEQNAVLFPYPISAEMLSTYLKASLITIQEVLHELTEKQILLETEEAFHITNYQKLQQLSKITCLSKEV